MSFALQQAIRHHVAAQRAVKSAAATFTACPSAANYHRLTQAAVALQDAAYARERARVEEVMERIPVGQ